MRDSNPSGIIPNVWDLTSDPFSHTQLAANFDAIDAAITAPPQQVEVSSTVPSSGNFAGRTVMLSVADSGFAAWTLIRYNGSAWAAVGPVEVLAAVPTLSLYAGRIVILSAASGGFPAWSLIRYDGTAWNVIGGFTQVNTGGGATNIVGLQLDGDIYVTNANRGLVQVDRVTGEKWRFYVSNGKWVHELVT